jgi:hypothetical protein
MSNARMARAGYRCLPYCVRDPLQQIAATRLAR